MIKDTLQSNWLPACPSRVIRFSVGELSAGESRASGAGAVHVTLVIAATLWLTRAGPINWTWWKLCLAAFGAGFVGKLAGLVLSRLRLNRLLNEVEQEFSKVQTSTATVRV